MSKSASKLFTEEDPRPMEENDMNLPVEDEVKKETAPEETKELPVVNDDIQDIQVDAIKRKRFRINQDNNKIIELNTTDIGVSYRLTEAYERLNKIMDEVQKKLDTVPDDEDLNDEQFKTVAESLKELNDNMCKEIDYIFDEAVSDKFRDGGSMYDPINGMFRYEYILDTITGLYENDLNREFTKMRHRVNERTAKYARGKSPTKKYAKH